MFPCNHQYIYVSFYYQILQLVPNITKELLNTNDVDQNHTMIITFIPFICYTYNVSIAFYILNIKSYKGQHA